MRFNRSAGILLHPTSLPGPDGMGDLGHDAHWWVQTMASTGIGLWQILPLGPTGYGDSPYQCFSAFAGNPLLVNSTLLIEEGLLDFNDISERPDFSDSTIDYGKVIPWKQHMLDQAFLNFQRSNPPGLMNEFQEFIENEKDWLDDFALFMAIKESRNGQPWSKWPEPIKRRNPSRLSELQKILSEGSKRHKFRQFLFFRQWQDLRHYANQLGVKIIGDIPIFIAHDSADAWANPDLFYFDKKRDPTVVAGVPPDYYAATGQLWGNPLYRWEEHKEKDYSWWINRVKATLKQVDIIRLDHFRGFVDYWEIPANMPTAEIGEWKPGPGKELFDAIEKALGQLPIIAEDLGQINPDVFVLRDALKLPGMKILQFAFGEGANNEFLPHHYPHNCVAYTGTHDNDTTVGWYQAAQDTEKDFCLRYLHSTGEDIAWDMIREIWSSVAVFAIAPLQDFLRKGTEDRMNYPGRPYSNWQWRFSPNELSDTLLQAIKELNSLYSR